MGQHCSTGHQKTATESLLGGWMAHEASETALAVCWCAWSGTDGTHPFANFRWTSSSDHHNIKHFSPRTFLGWLFPQRACAFIVRAHRRVYVTGVATSGLARYRFHSSGRKALRRTTVMAGREDDAVAHMLRPLQKGTKDYLLRSIVPSLVHGLTQMAIERPSDPHLWMAQYMLNKSRSGTFDIVRRYAPLSCCT